MPWAILIDSGAPVTVVRPSKVHGRGARPPREWFFVQRALDRRAAVILAHQGKGVDHTTAAVNIAAVIEVAAEHPGRRVLNSAAPRESIVRLYLFEHCSLCFRVRMIAALKRLHLQETVVLDGLMVPLGERQPGGEWLVL